MHIISSDHLGNKRFPKNSFNISMKITDKNNQNDK